MALRIRRTASNKVRLISTLIMALALVAQPFYGLVAGQVASAVEAPTITHVGPALVNASNYKGITVTIRTQHVTAAESLSVTVNRAAGGSVVKTAKQSVLNTINANDGLVKTVTAPIVIQNISYNEVGSGSWNLPSNSVWNSATVPQSVTVSITQAGGSVLETTSNVTGSTLYQGMIPPTPQLVNVDPYYVVSSYKGVGVDFNVSNLTDATGVEVKVDRTNGGSVIKTAKPSVINSLNAGGLGATAPIVIQQGSYNEAGSSSWNQPAAVWDYTTVPVSVTVTITRSGGEPLVMTKTLGEDAGPFATRSQVMPPAPDPSNQHVLRLSGDVYRDIAVDNCDNMGECKDQRTNELLSGWNMNLYKENNTGVWENVTTVTTGADGKYSFPAQQAEGTYHICSVTKTGWTQGIQTWSGSGYKVDTANEFVNIINENPYCTTTEYADTSDRSSTSHFGVVDTANPQISNITMFVNGEESRLTKPGDSVKISLTATDSQTAIDRVQIWVRNLDATSQQLASGNMVAEGNDTFSFSFTVPASYQGGHELNEALNKNYFNFRPYDTAGNNFISPSNKFTIDSTAPNEELNVTIKQNDQDLGCNAVITNRTITVDWNDDDDVNFDHYNYQNKDGGTIAEPTISEFTGTIRDQDDDYIYRVQAVDKAGNVGPWSDWCWVSLDREAPNVTITSPSNGSTVGNGAIQIRGTIDDENLRHYYIKIEKRNGLSWDLVHKATALSDAFTDKVLYTLPDTTNGEYRVMLEARDKAGGTATSGNKDSGSADQISFTVDNEAPSVSINPIGLTNDNTPTITGTVENDPANRIFLKIDGTEREATNNNDGTWTYQIVTPLSDGIHELEAVAKDAVENTTSPAFTEAMTVDATPPSFSIVDYSQNGNVIQPNVVITNPSPGDTYSWTTAPGVVISDPNALTPTFTVNVDGPYSFTLTITDAADNPSAQLFNFTYTSDIPGVLPVNEGLDDTNFTNVTTTATDATTLVELEDNDEAILGAKDVATPLESTAAITPTPQGWSFFGLAWYWWLLILAAIAATWWFLAARRRRAEEIV